MHDILPVAVTSCLLIGGTLGYVFRLASRLPNAEAAFWMPPCEEHNCPYARFEPPYITEEYLNDDDAKALGDGVASAKAEHMKLSRDSAARGNSSPLC